jgi:hypothetical protein
MWLVGIHDSLGDTDKRKALVEGVEAGDDLEIGHEVMEVERSSAVDAADIEEVLLGIFEEGE